MSGLAVRRCSNVLATLFGSTNAAVASLLLLGMAIWSAIPVIRWALLDAVWHGAPADCRPGGACWAYVWAKLSFFLFGFYPADLHWRAALATVLLLTALSSVLLPWFWNWMLLGACAGMYASALVLLSGGFGLPTVDSEAWGGLPLMLLLTTTGLGLGLPAGVVLALARRSRAPALRWPATALIELARGVPFISVLFMASLLVPLIIPGGLTPGKLVRAELAFALVAAAFIAEVLRGGLQAVSQGQSEGAAALGLDRFHALRLVILPQAFRIAIPGLANTAVVFLKDTSLVLVVGLTDPIGAVNAAAQDGQWLGHELEGYLFAACLYLILGLSLGCYAGWLEHELRSETH